MASSSSIFVLASAFLLLYIAAVAAHLPTAYEILSSHGFPEGLLPRTVQNTGEAYKLDLNGKFELHLEKTCRFTIAGGHEVKYTPHIKGSLTANRLHNLSGISVHAFRMWWNIDSITIDGKDLAFKVGPFSSSFPTENFVDIPVCSGGSGGRSNQ